MEFNTTCNNCSSKITEQMRFCPGCGRRLVARSRRHLVVGVLGALILFGAAFGVQMIARDGRIKPADHPAGRGDARSSKAAESGTAVGVSAVAASPEIIAMRSEVERAPSDMTKLKVFAGMLGDHLRSNPNADPVLVFEAIDVFGRILQSEPNDPGALVMMADLSFDQRAFTKALDFYERYLKIEPDDLGARSRYASTLTFLGRYDDSIAELGKVLASDPKNFPALAYLAITYAQKGEILKAKAIGGDALKLAPSDEARARFASFVSSLDQAAEGSSSKSPDSASVPDAAARGGIASFIETIRSNLVAGPKFAGYEQLGANTIRLKFNNFPMAQMPPFAKQKFFSGIKDSLAKSGLTDIEQVEFVDASSAEVLERLKVSVR
jgi:cytochrome c-type biogenesis protein CcmH/NrfG